MPQAHPTLRALMERHFGDLDDFGPATHLKACGWKEVGHGIFASPPGPPRPPFELQCMDFLISEWDYNYVGALPPELSQEP